MRHLKFLSPFLPQRQLQPAVVAQAAAQKILRQKSHSLPSYFRRQPR